LFYDFSDNTILSAKQILQRLCAKYLSESSIYLGGFGIPIEVNETVFSRRGVIRNPTSLNDEIRDTMWIGGAIDNTNQKKFVLKKVNNRNIENITSALINCVRPGSFIQSDGFRSYPAVAENLGCVHRFVNHNLGFVDLDGTHINNIEVF
jgi:hypothetical protein